MIETLGYIFAAILAVIALHLIYHVIRCAVIAARLMRWQLEGVNWAKIRNLKVWPLSLFRLYLNCWFLCIFYDGSVTYSHGADRWGLRHWSLKPQGVGSVPETPYNTRIDNQEKKPTMLKDFFHALIFAACIGLPFVIYFAFVMTP